MSIYFKNTNEPKKGFNNYVWSWLNSNLANFGKELSSYITGTTTNIKDEGSPIVSTHDINFVGAGVTVTENPLGVAEINIPGGGGIGGTNYIYVMADGTDVENAAELSAAYTTAQGMSPSATNIITIVCPPGEYNFGSTAFTMSTQYINLVSLDGNRSIIFNSSNAEGTISVTANDVFVKGIDVGTKQFRLNSNLNLLKVENCKGTGFNSFAEDPNISYNTVVSGTFKNCEAGYYGFSGEGIVSGTFIDCIAGTYSFAGDGGTASGRFVNCKAGSESFGTFGIVSGTFINCEGGTNAFGAGGTTTGTFEYCKGANSSFNGNTTSGNFRNCVGGSYSFGGSFNGVFSGTAENCVGGTASFGGGVNGTLTGKLYMCRLTAGSFKTVSGAGITRLCIDGSNVQNNQG